MINEHKKGREEVGIEYYVNEVKKNRKMVGYNNKSKRSCKNTSHRQWRCY